MSDSNDLREFTRYTIRPLELDDAEAVGELHVQAWREAYAGLMTEKRLADLDPQQRAKQWRTLAAERAEGVEEELGKVTRVAVHPNGEIAGFATVGPARVEDPPAPVEVWALYTLAKHYGTGVGGQLLAATLGGRAAYLWVLKGNERATAFYRKHAFELDGVVDDEDEDEVHLRMVRS